MDINTMSIAELQAALKAARAAAKEAKRTDETSNGLYLRVSAKGAVSVYGLGRWPATLYASQMRQLLDAKEDILSFLTVNEKRLAVKKSTDEQPAEQPAAV